MWSGFWSHYLLNLPSLKIGGFSTRSMTYFSLPQDKFVESLCATTIWNAHLYSSSSPSFRCRFREEWKKGVNPPASWGEPYLHRPRPPAKPTHWKTACLFKSPEREPTNQLTRNQLSIFSDYSPKVDASQPKKGSPDSSSSSSSSASSSSSSASSSSSSAPADKVVGAANENANSPFQVRCFSSFADTLETAFKVTAFKVQYKSVIVWVISSNFLKNGEF